MGFSPVTIDVKDLVRAVETHEVDAQENPLTNTVNFDGRVYPVGNKGIDFSLDAKSSFGRLKSLAGNPRIMQFTLRYQF